MLNASFFALCKGGTNEVNTSPLLAPSCKAEADEVNTLSFAPLCKGGVSRRLTGGLIAIYFVL